MIDALPLLLGDDGYQISRSVRLRSSASATFSRTPASASNRRTWTWSAWVKRGQLAVNLGLFSANQTKDDITGFYLNANDKLIFIDRPGNSTNALLATTLVFRDPSAWYHIMVVVDSTQATSANRIRFFVNGVQTTQHDAATYPSQNYEYAYINNTRDHRIGMFQDNIAQNFDGYLTEVNFIDGQALTPSSFGETDTTTGVWKPKKYAGTYGTNGFFLNFSDPSAATAAAIGRDYSGNGNNWTPNNISVTAGVTYDSMLDVPTPWADGGNGRGNYCTLNPLMGGAGKSTTSNGNLTATSSVGGSWPEGSYGSIAVASGKWYCEITPASGSTAAGAMVGVIRADLATSRWYYSATGNKYTVTTNDGAYGAAYTDNDVIGVALDMDAGTVTFYKNGTSQGQAYSGLTGEWVFGVCDASGGATVLVAHANFGQRPFAYTPPTGFRALNTQNLPEPTIVRGNRFFDVRLYTGNGSTQTISGLSLTPDFVWIKRRSGTVQSHQLYDTTRGVQKVLYSDLTFAETTDVNGITAFTSDGFSVGSSGGLNNNGDTHVAWQWREGATQGFDIVTYTGDGNTGTGASARAIAHSLGVAPRMIIVKRRNVSDNWCVYHAANSPNGAVFLNLTNGFTSSGAVYFSNTPTSSNFFVTAANGIGQTNSSGDTYVAYLFSEVAGFSRFGSYTGNGSADGPFVFCGFRPRWVMIKRTDSTADWQMYDTARGTVNVINTTLAANLSSAESAFTSGYDIDFLSNGFKPRSGPSNAINTSGGTYIFAAFAENPFKYSLAR